MIMPFSVVHAKAVKVGVLLPYTGPLAWVCECAGAVDLAVKEINEAGGVHGDKVVKVEADSEGKADASVAAARKLLDVDKVLAIIGPTSVTIRSVIPLGVERKNLIISPTAGTTALDKDPHGGKIVFRTVSSDTVMGSGIVYHAIELLTRNKPDVILYELSPPEGAIVFKEWTELGLTGQWIGTDFVNDKFAEFTWPASKGVKGVNPAALISPRYEAWAKDLQAVCGKPGVAQFSENAYDAMNIIALALEASKEVNRKAILDNIRKVSSPPGAKVNNFAEGAKLLRQGKDIDYDGVAGSQDFDKYGNSITFLRVVVIEGGKLNRIGTLTDKEVGSIVAEVLKLRK